MYMASVYRNIDACYEIFTFIRLANISKAKYNNSLQCLLSNTKKSYKYPIEHKARNNFFLIDAELNFAEIYA